MDSPDDGKALGRRMAQVEAGAWSHRWFVLAVVALVIAALMGRYSIAGGERAVHRIDRWTGEISICQGGTCR